MTSMKHLHEISQTYVDFLNEKAVLQFPCISSSFRGAIDGIWIVPGKDFEERVVFSSDGSCITCLYINDYIFTQNECRRILHNIQSYFQLNQIEWKYQCTTDSNKNTEVHLRIIKDTTSQTWVAKSITVVFLEAFHWCVKNHLLASKLKSSDLT